MMSSSFKTKSILSQQTVESLVSSGTRKGGEVGVNANKNSHRGMGRVSEKRPVSIHVDVIMEPFD